MTRTMSEAIAALAMGATVHERIGEWKITGERGLFLNAQYRKDDQRAVYDFGMSRKGTVLKLENIHREATKGTGTPTLKHLESALLEVARAQGIEVHVLFYLFGQKSTKSWLEKNNYTLQNGMYCKTITSATAHGQMR